MSRMATAADYRRELQSIGALLNDHERAVEQYGADFSSELAISALRSRLAELEAVVARLTDDELPGQELDVVLAGGPVQDHTVRAGFLGELLQDLQRVMFALVASQFGRIKSSGPWPEGVERRAALRVVETFPGSFGVKLEALDEQLELEGALAIQPAFEDLFQVLSSEKSGQAFLEQLAPLGPRARGHLRRLLERVAKADAEIQLRWPLLRGEKEARLRPSRARELSDTLKRIDETDRLEMRTGLLEGAILRTGYFELIDDEGEVTSGRVSPNVQAQVKEYFGSRVSATLLVTEVTDQGTGMRKETYRLMELNQVDDSEPRG